MAKKKKLTSKEKAKKALAIIADDSIIYVQKVAAFKELFPVWDMSDVIAACQMELSILGTSAEKSGLRSSWVRLIIDAQKWQAQQEQANQSITICIDGAKNVGL
jgi:uridine phosphorylase